MHFNYLIIATSLTLSACSMLNMPTNNEHVVKETKSSDNNFQSHNGKSVLAASKNTSNFRTVKNINHYVRGIMHGLVDNIQYVNSQTPIGVTSFVFLDGDYEKAPLIGNQLSESFMHELHKFGIPVIDFKTTDYIRVAPSGDYIFSRDFLELKGNLPIKYVLGGTLVRHESGYMVNARIVGVKSKAIVASSQGLIPSHAVKALLSSSLEDGIPLVQGDE
ncbi:hypothetical protein CJF42_06600 [Pseudoalteromonas sp. NBT06-2]|uniref:FlgO family outer membrane protein n=1 Tax=Pseudoalteromonas sp. NBT06-2 TaxID=2025950 RepID=UPI000BA7003D|nr:FlgO family outer membrane protein [Pseudoalteromonas sp. NBT06-2]PAJ75156.1 hypothetical protein CJF42_06600 [Pseudoalteromonas sp. NBT06-2]